MHTYLTPDWSLEMLNDVFRRVACGCLKKQPTSLSQLVCVTSSKSGALRRVVYPWCQISLHNVFPKNYWGISSEERGDGGTELTKMSKEEDRPSHIEEQIL